jgi:hypothetical protein
MEYKVETSRGPVRFHSVGEPITEQRAATSETRTEDPVNKERTIAQVVRGAGVAKIRASYPDATVESLGLDVETGIEHFQVTYTLERRTP